MPPRVVILGTGPNGLPYHSQLDGFIIGVNAAIEIRPLDIWIIGDPRVLEYSYVREPKHDARIKVFNHKVIADAPDLIPDYMFKPVLILGRELTRGACYSGVTNAGIAMQLAWQAGARELILCGLDLFGDKHFDGSDNPHVRAAYGTGEWGQLRKMNILVRQLQAEGVNVKSVSPTAIEGVYG